MNVHYGDGGVDGKSISDGIAPLPKGERSPTKKHQCMAKRLDVRRQKRDDATLHNKKSYVRRQKKREPGIASQSFGIQVY